MEALGGIIIFFSWVVTNALAQRCQRLRTSLESARRTYRLYQTLHELRSMINSLGLELIQGLPKGINATRFRAGKHRIDEVDRMREKFCLQAASAHQVRELLDFMSQTHELAKSVDARSNTTREILDEFVAAERLRDRLQNLESEAEREMAQSNSFVSERQFTAIPEYVKYYRDQVLPQVPHFYQRIAELSNQSQKKAGKALERSKRYATIARYGSFVLYAIGSTLVLTSKLLDNGP